METSCTGCCAPYSLTCSEQVSADHIRYTTYGIDLHMPGGGVQRIRDISSDQNMVGKMVELFNLCQLPPERLKSAIVCLLP